MRIKVENTDKLLENQNQSNPFKFIVLVGANNMLRITKDLNSFSTNFMIEVVDHKEYDVYYLIAILATNETKTLKISTTFSNDA